MLVVHGAVRQWGVVAVRVPCRVEGPGSIKQCQAIGEFVMVVMATLGHDRPTVAIASMNAAVDPAGAWQGCVLQNVAVHFGGLVQVPRRVILWRQTEREGILLKPPTKTSQHF